LGFHLSDGTLYTYLQGDEYEDIPAAWDWNLIPGTTVDYGATPLNCAQAQWTGLESFVGGTSDGKTGVAAMKYLNPLTQAFGWKKAWFFLDDDTQYVMIADLTSDTNAPVYSVLDQKRHSDTIHVNNDVFHSPGNQTFNRTVSSLWHGGVGYLFDSEPPVLSLFVGELTGAWSAIGTSTQPPETVDIFAAWIEHQDPMQPVSYTVFPGTTFDRFLEKTKERHVIPLQNDAHISAIFDADYGTVSAVFWDASGGTLGLDSGPPSGLGLATVSVNANVALILNSRTGTFTVSDPSQTLTSLEVRVKKIQDIPLTFLVELPQDGLAGSSITWQFL
jgi:Polysaccharide lyase family 8, super-sandwich domain/Polysaccharide lyase family 8, C-terminal beta-sandwich domain